MESIYIRGGVAVRVTPFIMPSVSSQEPQRAPLLYLVDKV